MICGNDRFYNLYTCLCTNENLKSFPDIKIQLGTNVYVLPKESYITKVSPRVRLNYCRAEASATSK